MIEDIVKGETGGSVIHQGELDMLAREMAATYKGMVAHYEKEYKIKRSEARKKATTHSPEYYELANRDLRRNSISIDLQPITNGARRKLSKSGQKSNGGSR